ncbi:MAG: ATP-binding protein [Thiolinea sp.]
MPPQILNKLQRYRQNLQRSSALQQGLLSISIFLISLFLLSIVTYFYVQDALAKRLDDSLKQRMIALQEQVAEEWDDEGDEFDQDDYEELPFRSRDNVLGRPVFYRLFPQTELDKKQNRMFRQTGYTTRMFRQKQADDDDDDDMLVYRMLVRHDKGLVLVVGENNDEDHEIIEIVMSAFMLNGLVALILTALLVMYLGNRSHRQIRRIEHVLQHAAQGDLKQRIASSGKNNDLAHVSDQIDTMLSRLETSMAAMADISANIAHELKTPVSRLRHDLIAALEQHDTGEDVEEALNNAYDEAGYIAETFDALLRISQIEGGARRANFTELELENIIRVVQDIYTEVAEDAGMQLLCDIPEKTAALSVLGDKELLIQMLANLVENAIRYCSAGTQICINLRPVIIEQHKQIELVVADNGSGIPETEREKVFQRLYRLDKSRSDGRGTGLGLSLVKAIIELHNAEIGLQDNTPGLRVVIRFPVRDAVYPDSLSHVQPINGSAA